MLWPAQIVHQRLQLPANFLISFNRVVGGLAAQQGLLSLTAMLGTDPSAASCTLGDEVDRIAP